MTHPKDSPTNTPQSTPPDQLPTPSHPPHPDTTRLASDGHMPYIRPPERIVALPPSVRHAGARTRRYERIIDGHNTLVAIVQWDDECGNGHNTFSITGAIYRGSGARALAREPIACGCIHEEIARAVPELAPLIQYHLVSSDGPLHYIANTMYWWRQWREAGPLAQRDHLASTARYFAALANMRTSACWPDSTIDDFLRPELDVVCILLRRLPTLMHEFKAAIESLGFEY